MKHISKFIAATATVLGLSLGMSSDAHAAGSAQGYVCDVTHYPMSSSMGDAGYVYFGLYSGAACSGSYLGSYYLMTAGNSYPGNNYYTEAGQLAHYRNLLQASYSGKQVYVAAPSNPGYIAANVWFYGY